MSAWKLHRNLYFPVLAGARKRVVPPRPGTVTSKSPFVPEVRVWLSVSLFLTVTFVPGATEGGTV